MGAGGGSTVGLYVVAVTLGGTLELIWVVIAVLIGIGLLIFVHELGHFLVAKACGVKCEKFYLGFDVPLKIGPLALPRTLGKIRLGETEYGIGIIPLGGYVKMLGQDDNPANAQKEAERIRVAKKTAEPGAETDANAPATEEQYELDPRSYPAKSVPQRMAIISAGVIMNLISAVVFAAIAYGMGVTYEPCEIGSVAGGSPAWVNNVPIGAKIVQIDRSGSENDHLRFDWDLMQKIALHGTGAEPTPIDLNVQLPGGKQEWISIAPSDRLVKRDLAEFATLGVRMTRAATMAPDMPVIPYMAAGKADPALAGGDRIVAIEGKTLDTSRANERGDVPADDLEMALAAHLSQPLALVVERTPKDAGAGAAPQSLHVTLPPQPLRTVGLALHIGPIEAVRNDSPAAQAGLQVGDVLLRVKGQPVGDPLVLPQQFESWIGQSVRLEISRPSAQDKSPLEIQITPEARYRYDLMFQKSALVTIESIGVAYSVGNQVAAVEPDSPAAKAGMRPGDVLEKAQFVSSR
jgi:regulator of sigma E protease